MTLCTMLHGKGRKPCNHAMLQHVKLIKKQTGARQRIIDNLRGSKHPWLLFPRPWLKCSSMNLTLGRRCVRAGATSLHGIATTGCRSGAPPSLNLPRRLLALVAACEARQGIGQRPSRLSHLTFGGVRTPLARRPPHPGRSCKHCGPKPPVLARRARLPDNSIVESAARPALPGPNPGRERLPLASRNLSRAAARPGHKCSCKSAANPSTAESVQPSACCRRWSHQVLCAEGAKCAAG